VLIGDEVRIERHAKETALARRIDRERHKGRWQEHAILDYAQPSALLAHE
jgi:hypothetical protein